MPLADIRLLFETLVQRTRDLCKCEMRQNGSKECNIFGAESREPVEIAPAILRCTAKSLAGGAAMLDRRGRAP
jgi:hypothetical protein